MKNKFSIEINTDDLAGQDSPQKKRPQLDTLGQKRDYVGRALPTGKSAISALQSTSNYGARGYRAAGPTINPADMWKDLSNNLNDQDAEDLKLYITKKRIEDDTEYFETEADDVDFSRMNEKEALKAKDEI